MERLLPSKPSLLFWRVETQPFKLCRSIRLRLHQEIADLSAATNGHFQPHLVIVQVGDREDSSVYVRMKQQAAQKAGIKFSLHKLPADVSQTELLGLIDTLNADPSLHGILVQLPLPPGFDERLVTESIDHKKDVDGIPLYEHGRTGEA
ncbi:hypothetical protein BDR26DRAFT_57452 [Obelidium mucronatum]|nr:hypothetical protein BDR26DRAFT_57452 [Obelidium mucronatum]